MVFARHIRLAVVGMAVLSFAGQAQAAQATFQFNSCVGSCITSSGCQPNNAKCMCKDAQSLLLDSVISCLFFSCKQDLRDFEASFLDPIADGCDASDRGIPSSKIKAAASLASSYISKLTPLTTSSKPTSTSAVGPKTTTTSTAPSTSKNASSSSSSSASTSSTQTDDDSSTSTASVAAQTTAAPTRVTAPTSTASSTSSPGSDSGSGFDTNPFGSTGGSACLAVPPLLSLLGLPLAVAVVGGLAGR